LLKILDVEKPLSIQLHPTKFQAEKGFEAENAKGVALTDSTRTYKDRNHKPEMMIALSDFWLLHGFKTKSQIFATLNARPSLQPLAEKLGTQGLAEFYADVMLADQSTLANWLLPIIEANQQPYKNGELALDNPDYWVLYTMEAMAISPEKGLVCFYLFNIVHLKEGEGIFQDAGIPHAYLRGQNVELMACSDNVIRGGLTPKYVDIVELLKIVDCREIIPQIISAASQNQSEFTYKTPVKDFALAQIRVESEQQTEVNLQSAGILLVMQGELKIQEKSTALTLKQGESAFITADSNLEIMSEKGGYAFLAKLP